MVAAGPPSSENSHAHPAQPHPAGQTRAPAARRSRRLAGAGDQAIGGWTFDGAPIAMGEAWPEQMGVHRFAGGPFEVPAGWPLEETRLALDVGGESLLEIHYDGAPKLTLGLDVNHNEFLVDGRGGRLEIESVAKSPFGQAVVRSAAAARRTAPGRDRLDRPRPDDRPRHRPGRRLGRARADAAAAGTGGGRHGPLRLAAAHGGCGRPRESLRPGLRRARLLRGQGLAGDRPRRRGARVTRRGAGLAAGRTPYTADPSFRRTAPSPTSATPTSTPPGCGRSRRPGGRCGGPSPPPSTSCGATRISASPSPSPNTTATWRTTIRPCWTR